MRKRTNLTPVSNGINLGYVAILAVGALFFFLVFVVPPSGNNDKPRMKTGDELAEEARQVGGAALDASYKTAGKLKVKTINAGKRVGSGIASGVEDAVKTYGVEVPKGTLEGPTVGRVQEEPPRPSGYLTSNGWKCDKQPGYWKNGKCQ